MTFEEFKNLNSAVGFWFHKDTMRCFQSEVHDFDEETGCFISSEVGPAGNGPRKYTLRRGNFKTGRVSSLSRFQEFTTLEEARNALMEMI